VAAASKSFDMHPDCRTFVLFDKEQNSAVLVSLTAWSGMVGLGVARLTVVGGQTSNSPQNPFDLDTHKIAGCDSYSTQILRAWWTVLANSY
jgi:hypothetical protein